MTSGDQPAADQSLSERLRRRYGVEIDPQVELESERSRATEPPSETASNPSGPSGVLGRLGARSPSASRYRFHGEIARGGMGAILEVYDEDLRRKLAMKVVLDGDGSSMGTSSDKLDPVRLARFLEEAQVTGQLDHPGIVPVHELGLDRNGQVYFTMRLVRGRDLGAIFKLVEARAEDWTTTRALGVLLKVCEAMAFAHQKGVVHRDLKPANVMVGQFGEVYVMDWGLARIRDRTDRHDPRTRAEKESAVPRIQTDPRGDASRGATEGLYTLDGDVVGTPAYMALEQARGRLDLIDERTDVYALGAMLHRLLAGTPPYLERDEKVGAGTVLERVLAGPPRSLEARAPGAPPELVAITQRAMARDPMDRYADMLALANDLRAFLEGRVVSAWETGAWAEARKWVRRNTALAATMAALALALAGGFVTSLVLADRARASAAVAEQRRVQADASAEAARRQTRIASEVNEFLNDDLLAAVAPENRGRDVSVREVLDAASMRLGLRFGEDPRVEAALRMTIGTSYERLGAFEDARRHLERALELRRASEGERAEPTLQSMRSVAAVWSELGRLDEAADLYREALDVARETLGPDDRGVSSTLNDLALVLRRTARNSEARALFAEALEIQERVLGRDHHDTLSTLNNLAVLDRDEGRFAESARALEDVLARRRRALGDRHPETLDALSNLALARGDAGDLDGAESLAREALDARLEILGPDHPRTGRALGNLGTLVLRRGRAAEAEPLFEESLRIARAHYGDLNAETSNALGNLASVFLDTNRPAEALPLWTEAVETRRKLSGPEHPDTLSAMNSLAVTYRNLRQFERAEELYRETVELQRKVLGPDHPSTIVTYENLGGVLFARGAFAESEAITRAVLESRRRVLGEDHPDVAKTTFNLAMVEKGAGKPNEALALVEDALARLRRISSGPTMVTVQCLRLIGELRSAADEHSVALASYVEALAMYRELRPDDRETAYLTHQVGAEQFSLDDFAAALASFEEAFALRERLLGPADAGTRVSLYMRARSLLALSRHAEAETIAIEFHARSLRAVGPSHEHTQRGRKLLADLYAAWSRPEEAEKWR